VNKIYSIANDTLNGAVANRDLHNEIMASDIVIVLDSVSTADDILTIKFKAALSVEDEATLTALVAAHTGVSTERDTPTIVDIHDRPVFSNTVLSDGSILYLKIHGMMGIVPAATLDENDGSIIPGELELEFTIPYPEVYMQGMEIFSDILCMTDMQIKHPMYGVLEKYGFNVCVGVQKYIREADYAARLPQGLVISAMLKNVELVDQEMGVNFILHEIRSPE
jgi:hypothetical protein